MNQLYKCKCRSCEATTIFPLVTVLPVISSFNCVDIQRGSNALHCSCMRVRETDDDNQILNIIKII